MKILLTGSSGFIGRNIQNQIRQNGHELFIFNMRDHGKLIEGPEIDVAIHCASATPDNTADQLAIFKNNEYIIEKLAHLVEKFKIKKIINLSSVAVYGKSITGTIDESPISNGLDLYGLSKLYTEKYLNNKYLNTDIKILHLRIPGVTGRGAGNIYLKRILEKISSDTKIEVNDGKLPFNNILDIDDLTKYIVKQLLPRNPSAPNTATNLASTLPIPLLEVIKLFYKYLKKPIDYTITNQYYPHFNIDIRKALSEGFDPLTTHDATIKFIKENT